MSPEAQRIAIAEACGWSDFWVGELTGVYGSNPNGSEAKVPDYLNDLNAMHEAEEAKGLHKLNDAAWEYRTKLQGIVVRPALLYAATATQRAEAFLRTIRKWEDDE